MNIKKGGKNNKKNIKNKLSTGMASNRKNF